MKRFPLCAVIDPAVQVTLDAVATARRAKHWDTKGKAVKAFKKAIHDQGLTIQDHRCAWCTLLIGEKGRRTVHRDHIAPKALYPQWTFTPKNLVLACEYCNGFTVKADLDTVGSPAADYEDSQFLLVHPYLDDPADHLEFAVASGDTGVVIRAKNASAKGVWTIANLKLDSGGLTLERAKDLLIEQQRAGLPANYRELLERALSRI